MVLSVDIRK